MFLDFQERRLLELVIRFDRRSMGDGSGDLRSILRSDSRIAFDTGLRLFALDHPRSASRSRESLVKWTFDKEVPATQGAHVVFAGRVSHDFDLSPRLAHRFRLKADVSFLLVRRPRPRTSLELYIAIAW